MICFTKFKRRPSFICGYFIQYKALFGRIDVPPSQAFGNSDAPIFLFYRFGYNNRFFGRGQRSLKVKIMTSLG
jgi:hypothetical protein